MSGKDNRFDGDLIGVDVGGTFTDLIRLDQASGAVRLLTSAQVEAALEQTWMNTPYALDAFPVCSA